MIGLTSGDFSLESSSPSLVDLALLMFKSSGLKSRLRALFSLPAACLISASAGDVSLGCLMSVWRLSVARGVGF